MKNKITLTGANITFFAFTVAFLAFSFSMIIPVFIFGEDFPTKNFVPITLISQYGIILIPVIVFVLIKKLDIKEVFRLNNPGLLPCILIILMVLPATYAGSALNSIVLFLLDLIGEIPKSPIPVPQSLKDVLIMIFVIGVTPGICEELLNRGIMLKAYEKRGTSRAIIYSGVLFGIFHFDIQNLFGPIVLGLLFGYYVTRTNSIFSSMLAHFVNNSFAVIMLYLQRKDPSIEASSISIQQLGYSLLLGVVCTGLLLILLKFFKMATKSTARVVEPISSVKKDIISIISHWPMIVVLILYILLNILTVATIVLTGMFPGK